MLFVFLLLPLAFGLAPLFTAKEPNDRAGLREYIALLDGPRFGHSVERLRNWVKRDFAELDPDNFDEIWAIGNFSAFPAWLSLSQLYELRLHRYIRLVEEVQPNWIASITPIPPPSGQDFLSRQEWGHMASLQKLPKATPETNPALNTVPCCFYDPSATEGDQDNYPQGSSPLSSWNWASDANGGPPPFSTSLNTGGRAQIHVIDSGILLGHQEFWAPNGTLRITYGVDCAGEDKTECVAIDFATDPGDVNGHGTHCAGTAAGNWRGIAPDADLGIVRIFEGPQATGFSTWTIRGFDYVANHRTPGKFNIASASIGGPFSPSVNAATDAVFDLGILAVVAAGNDGHETCLNSPASANNAVTVGAINATSHRADFSNFGPGTDIFAPGVAIHSAWIPTASSYNQIDGTSMATPHVSGAMAVYATSRPNLRNDAPPTGAVAALFRWATEDHVKDAKVGSMNRILYAKFQDTLLMTDEEEAEMLAEYLKTVKTNPCPQGTYAKAKGLAELEELDQLYLEEQRKRKQVDKMEERERE